MKNVILASWQWLLSWWLRRFQVISCFCHILSLTQTACALYVHWSQVSQPKFNTTVLQKTFRLTWFYSAPLRIFAWEPKAHWSQTGLGSCVNPRIRLCRRSRSSRTRGSLVYKINTWLWNFGRPQPRVGGLSVAKTERIRRQSRSETSLHAWETRKARWHLNKYDKNIPGIC